MKYLAIALLVIIILMSLAAGGAKVFQTPQEVAFFAAAGLGNAVMLVLGVVQIIGAVLAALPKFRTFGCFIIAAGFFASALVILLTGNLIFAAISLVPVAIAVFVGMRVPRTALKHAA